MLRKGSGIFPGAFGFQGNFPAFISFSRAFTAGQEARMRKILNAHFNSDNFQISEDARDDYTQVDDLNHLLIRCN